MPSMKHSNRRAADIYDGMPHPKIVVPIGIVVIAFTCIIGFTSLASQTPATPEPSPAAEQTTSPGADVDPFEDALALLPETTPVGLLDRQDVRIDDGKVSTIVTTDGSGKVEYGVLVEGPAAERVEVDELTLITASGKIFTPDDLAREKNQVSTTINAEHGVERWVALRWVDDDVIRFLLYTPKSPL